MLLMLWRKLLLLARVKELTLRRRRWTHRLLLLLLLRLLLLAVRRVDGGRMAAGLLLLLLLLVLLLLHTLVSRVVLALTVSAGRALGVGELDLRLLPGEGVGVASEEGREEVRGARGDDEGRPGLPRRVLWGMIRVLECVDIIPHQKHVGGAFVDELHRIFLDVGVMKPIYQQVFGELCHEVGVHRCHHVGGESSEVIREEAAKGGDLLLADLVSTEGVIGCVLGVLEFAIGGGRVVEVAVVESRAGEGGGVIEVVQVEMNRCGLGEVGLAFIPVGLVSLDTPGAVLQDRLVGPLLEDEALVDPVRLASREERTKEQGLKMFPRSVTNAGECVAVSLLRH